MNGLKGECNYTTAMDSASSFISETKLQKVKKLIAAIDEYLKIRSQDSSVLISRYLQGLSVTIDISIFDPHSNLAAEFYVSLHELLKNVETISQIAWYCVDVLSNACRNPAARYALITTYQFIPSLSRLISDQLTLDKKIRLLKLMQELSCGIKISWQIPHLPHLLSTLAKWVECGHEEIVTLSLGVLVNMCYKNLPAIYTLSRHVDIKKFIRICMPLQGSVIEVHVCKLLIILDYMNSVIPENHLVKLIDSTFKWLGEAFRQRDAILMRQITEFYLDILQQDREPQTLQSYSNYGEEVKNLLQVIENNPLKTHAEGGTSNNDPECMSLVFEFLQALIEKRIPQLTELHPQLITLALKWIHTNIASTQALSILKTIAMQTEKSDNEILKPLVVGLPAFLPALNSMKEDEIPTHTEHNRKLAGLFLLLRAMVQVESIRPKVLQELQPDAVLRVFVPLIGEGESPRMRAAHVDTCSTEAVNLYVCAIALIHELSKCDSVWINRHGTLMQYREIHMVLAQALYSSPIEVKKLVLDMATATNFPSKTIAEAMGNLQSMILINPTLPPNNNRAVNEINFPVLSPTQVDRLDETLNRIKSQISDQNLANISTSDVMELYEYKLSAMGHAERAAMASVEAASERCTHLQHQTAQLTAELNRLHQLLFRTQQCHEEALRSKSGFEATTSELKNKLEAEKGRHKACASQLRNVEKQLEECREQLADVGKKLAETKASQSDLESQNAKLKQVVSKLEENGTRLEKNLQKKDEQLKKANANLHDLKLQVQEMDRILKNKEFEIQTKVDELQTVKKDLMAKKQIIDTIMNVANSQLK
ncbi:uncharacterized protein LOC109608400 [Aethina tumida]|uniref:uncharacterized protein LOC109608400 n=1 Tax=Aethina tumida TaxID=116153 RepID=UPI00096B0973|nr:uncharacterized protein LOC109608400 [Aethina tumida]